MIQNNIKYPIALHKETNTLMDISDALNGKKCKCICLDCKEYMVAYNEGKIQHPHFRHQPNSNCKGNYETYIHKLAKEIFKEIKQIELPEIKFSYIGNRGKFDVFNKKITALYNKYYVPKNFRQEYRLDFMLQKPTFFPVENYSTEKVFKVGFNHIEVDIVIKSDKNYLLIEPYYSNPIDENKLKKIKNLDLTTISINLRRFNFSFSDNITIDSFKSYIISKESKNWVYIRASKIEKLKNKFLSQLEVKLKQNSNFFKESQSLKKMLTENEQKNYDLLDKFRKNSEILEKKSSEIKNKISLIEKKYYTK